MSRPIVILGIGGHAKSIVDLVSGIGYDEIYLCDFLNNSPRVNLIDNVKSYSEVISSFQKYDFAIGIGDQNLRRELLVSITKNLPEASFPYLVHRNAYVSKSAIIGKGSIIFSGSYVGPDVVLGNWCIINTNSVVEHDSKVGELCTLSLGVIIAGNVVIEDDCYIGMGALVSNSITIGGRVKIYAGSFVNQNVMAGTSVKGIPARAHI